MGKYNDIWSRVKGFEEIKKARKKKSREDRVKEVDNSITSEAITISDAEEIANGLYIGGNFEELISYINAGNETKNKIRFFLGYSGWDPLQLESEIKHNVWAVTNHHNNQDLLCGENDKYWHRYVKSMGDEYKGWRYHPENPQLN